MAELQLTSLSGSTLFELRLTELSGSITPYVASELRLTNLTGIIVAMPVPYAGSDRFAEPLSVVTLDGSSSRYVTAYSWSQTAGTTVSLQNANSAITTFTSPASITTEQLTFRLTGNNTATDDIVISVYPQLEWYYDGSQWKPQTFTEI